MEGTNLNKIFSLVVKHYFIRELMEIVNQYDLDLEQVDIETNLLHVDLEEIIYMEKI